MHLFVFTLGYSRRVWVRAYPHERLTVVLEGHEQAFRHTVRMDPAHYRGLLRAETTPARARPPQWDPAYRPVGEVVVRDLALYAAVAEQGGAA